MRLIGIAGRGNRSLVRVIRHSRAVKMDPFIPTPATTPARRGTTIRAQAVQASVVIVIAVVAAVGTTWAKSGEGSAREQNKAQSASTTRPAEPRAVARGKVAGGQSGTDAITDATPQVAAYKVKAEHPARKSDAAGHSGATDELLHEAPAVA